MKTRDIFDDDKAVKVCQMISKWYKTNHWNDTYLSVEIIPLANEVANEALLKGLNASEKLKKINKQNKLRFINKARCQCRGEYICNKCKDEVQTGTK